MRQCLESLDGDLAMALLTAAVGAVLDAVQGAGGLTDRPFVDRLAQVLVIGSVGKTRLVLGQELPESGVEPVEKFRIERG